MATDDTTEVKEPIVPDEDIEETDPDSSLEDGDTPEGDEPDEDVDEEPEITPTPAIVKKVEVSLPTVDGITRLADESDREWALRLENNRLRREKRENRGKEITEQGKPQPVITEKKESEILKKYKPEDIQALREVFPEIASDMGFVRKDELASDTYTKVGNEQIEAFILEHPEYSEEKDPEGTLWAQLRSEYNSYYKPPTNPKDFKKIFERIHKDIFGIQPKGSLPKETAAREKIKVASHGGPSTPTTPRTPVRQSANSGLRLDMLKGFSDEDKANIEARATE